jgi:putative RNA 2'-phosphotransferase
VTGWLDEQVTCNSVEGAIVNEERLVKISKYLARHLRHRPEQLGLTLAPDGWVPIHDLLVACGRHNFPITRAELDEVVARNNKQRYSYDPSGTLIRANQGHSVAVDLHLQPAAPPEVLYHGTGERSVEAILHEGLRKMARHHVHLSPDLATARAVGARHGPPVILAVAAVAMQRDGHTFYLSENGVWLVDHVPPAYLRRL